MADFNQFISQIAQAEGGYQKISTDPGNYNSLGQLVGTNHGISAKTYERILGYPPSEQDMRNVSLGLALNIFKRFYWDKVKGDYINSQAVAETLTDHAINSGVKTAAKLMQRALRSLGYDVTVDGVIGNQTLTAINDANAKDLFNEFNERRRLYYHSLKNFVHWGKIWLNRIRALEKKHFPFLYKHGHLFLFIFLFLVSLSFYLKYRRV